MSNPTSHPERPGGSERVSRHFLASELWCHHCHRLLIDPQLPPLLEDLREELSSALGQDTPLHINSAYRCPAKNASLTNSAATSRHMRGQAADISVRPPATLLSLYHAAMRLPSIRRCGLGLYPTSGFLHIDCRGYAARWGELNGNRTTLEEALRTLQNETS